MSRQPSQPSSDQATASLTGNNAADAGVQPQIPDVELLRSIGQGAYGEVWLARNTVTSRLVAAKIIRRITPSGILCAERELAALRHEAKGQIQSDHLVEIYHVGQTNELLYYLMELADDLDGSRASASPSYQPLTLAARMKVGPIPLYDCVKISTQLLEGISALHQVGIIHRDIKPTNCLFVQGNLRLADIGLLADADTTASIVGTPKYMPPDRRMDERADVYAAGLVIYEMFTGLPADNFPRWPVSLVHQSSDPALRALNLVVLKACQADPTKRYDNALEMIAALQSHLSDQPKKQSRRMMIGTLAVLMGLGATLSPFWLTEIPKVDVDFVTRPFEADVYLDGQRLVGPSGEAIRTPCTASGLIAKPTRVVFKKHGLEDIDFGVVDIAQQRLVEVQWP